MVIVGAGAEPLVPHGHELPRHHQHAGDVRMRRPVGRRLVALCRTGKAAPANGLAAARLRARLGPSAAADELDLGLLRAHRPVALRDARRVGSAVADRAGGPVGRRADRLQCARRAHGLAAVRAAAPDQSARSVEACRRRRHGGQGLRRQGAEIRRAQAVMRRPGQSGQLAAQHVHLALQPARRVGQGPRVFSQASARHQARRAWARIWARTARRSRRTSSGTTRRRKESSTCSSRSTSACRRPACTPTSFCRPRPGTRRTTSTPPTCIPSFIR